MILPTVRFIQTDKAKASTEHHQPERKCVLIADDERALRTILSRKLQHAGYKVLQAADGQEAVDVFTEHRDTIDCVLLDLSMPKLSGEETQQAMHALRKDLPIVMMSGFSEQEVVDRFRDAGIAGCLQKPVSITIIVETIRRAINKSS